jgi:hypothetical protein
MQNLAMLESLRKGQALDVRKEGRLLENGMYELHTYIEGKDYCDPHTERWIWSIGQRFADNKIYAATDARFYNNPNYSCLFLR